MKFLKALFNIISIVNPFRIYNCILCYLATSGGLVCKNGIAPMTVLVILVTSIAYIMAINENKEIEDSNIASRTSQLQLLKSERQRLLPLWYLEQEVNRSVSLLSSRYVDFQEAPQI